MKLNIETYKVEGVDGFSTVTEDYTTRINTEMSNSNSSTLSNDSNGLPNEMVFGEQHIITVALYSCFFLIAATGNLTVFITLFRNRGNKTRVNIFIMHLSIADLFVTFIMMPLEIGWNITVDWRAGDYGCRILMFFRAFGLYLSSFVLVVISLDRYFAILHPLSLNDADKRGQIMLTFAWLFSTIASIPQIGWNITVDWRAGDYGCRILMFFRAFGLYLSSFVLVVISLDRYFAILHPLSLNDADKRGQIMLTFAWLFSTIASIPQSVIFHEEGHPDFPWFKQCVTFNFFPTPTHKLIYNLFHMLAMYGLPLVIMTLSYSLILIEISKKTRQSREEMQELNSAQKINRLRRSAVGNIERARTRTLKMTIVIVGVFIFCWTPYFVIAVWWWVDSESAGEIDARIQKGLFMFAVSNSCMNPIVYGLFTINFKREFVRCCCCFRSNWSQKKLIMAFTRNYFWRTHHKSPYTRTSYSSVRTPYSSSFTKFNNNGRMGGGRNHACVRYQCNGPNCVNKVTLGYRINHVNLPTIQTKHHCADGNNDNLQACQGSDLNRSLKIRSVSDSGIALRNFTPSSQPTEEQEKSASV